MATATFARPLILAVVQQHAEESAMLRHVRSVLVRAPHVRLRHLRRLDDRIAAHLDGVAVAGAFGSQLCTAALERAGAGEVFAATVRAVEDRDAAALDRLVALAQSLPDARRGFLSALGWVSAVDLKGIVRSLLDAPDPFRRSLAISACRLHRTDPGLPLLSALADGDPGLRASALRAAGDLGRVDTRAAVGAAVADADAECAYRAAAAAVLLGDRADALGLLEHLAQSDSPHRDAATQLLLLASSFQRGQALMRRIAQDGPRTPMLQRRVIRACGLLGDTQAIAWLADLMADDRWARLAGESFSLITGADLAALDLERKPPADGKAGPNADPGDDDVALDEDESLPWPEPGLVQGWWMSQAARMPATARCFMGAAPTREHCTEVLREGTQRQRFVAAQHLCLLTPGTSLFPLCAPAWRQARLLAV